MNLLQDFRVPSKVGN